MKHLAINYQVEGRAVKRRRVACIHHLHCKYHILMAAELLLQRAASVCRAQTSWNWLSEQTFLVSVEGRWCLEGCRDIPVRAVWQLTLTDTITQKSMTLWENKVIRGYSPGGVRVPSQYVAIVISSEETTKWRAAFRSQTVRLQAAAPCQHEAIRQLNWIQNC